MAVTQFEVKERVARITLDRPDALNALNPELRYELSRHFDEVAKNETEHDRVFEVLCQRISDCLSARLARERAVREKLVEVVEAASFPGQDMPHHHRRR